MAPNDLPGFVGGALWARLGVSPRASAASAAAVTSKPGQQRRCRTVQVSGAEHDLWRLRPIIEMLQDPSLNAVGILPTDTSYAFVCNVRSRTGVERIYALKRAPPSLRKPLSLLCRDHASIQCYSVGVDRSTFRVLKMLLPGPYTFILPASSAVPRVLLESREHRKLWRRKEVGVRWPGDVPCQAVLDGMDGVALLASSVPEQDTEGSALAQDPMRMHDEWAGRVDFIVDAGFRAAHGCSTVVDVGRDWEILRCGAGYPALMQALGRDMPGQACEARPMEPADQRWLA